jgi:hypothetical protein
MRWRGRGERVWFAALKRAVVNSYHIFGRTKADESRDFLPRYLRLEVRDLLGKLLKRRVAPDLAFGPYQERVLQITIAFISYKHSTSLVSGMPEELLLSRSENIDRNSISSSHVHRFLLLRS